MDNVKPFSWTGHYLRFQSHIHQNVKKPQSINIKEKQTWIRNQIE